MQLPVQHARSSVLLMLTLLLSGCSVFASSSTVHIDWLNFVQFHGITYLADLTAGATVPHGELGSVYATVRFDVSDHVHEAGYQIRDGDAAYLTAGTPVYLVDGYAPTFRLAAWFSDGRLLSYEAERNPQAKTGADLLDIGGKVLTIGVNDTNQPQTQLGMLTNSRQVTTLTGLVLHAPVNQQQLLSHGNLSYLVVFHLRDGTSVVRLFWPDSGELVLGIRTPPAFVSAIVHMARRSAMADRQGYQ